MTRQEKEAIYREVEREYLKQDLENMVEELRENDTLWCGIVTAEEMDQMIELYHKQMDCNIAYNATLEDVIKQVMRRYLN